MGDQKTSRLFFALWPDKGVRKQIQATSFPKLNTKNVPPENWHITLVFLGTCSEFQQSRFIQAADDLRAEPFQLSLDTTGRFSRARVVWLGCRSCPEALQNVQRNLATELRRACPDHPSFSAPLRPYIPHLTLYRNIEQPYSADFISPISWKVNGFRLLESRRGVQPVYRTIKSWQFLG